MHRDGGAARSNDLANQLRADPGSGGRFRFIPWGIDGTFGNGNPLIGMGDVLAPAVFPRGMLPRRLYLNPTTQAAYIARLTELIDDVWDPDAILAEIDRMELLITPVAGDLTSNLAPLRSWVSGRRAQVLGEISGGPPPWTEPLDDPACIETVGSISATFSTTWGSLDPPSGFAAMTLILDGVTVPHSIVVPGAGQNPAQPPHLGTVRVVGIGNGGVVDVVEVNLDQSLFVPGTVPLDEDFNALVIRLPTGAPAGGVQLLGFITNGSVTFNQAGTTPGATVFGSVTGDLATFVPLAP